MRSITIGQYYPGGSIIHRLDARVKLIGVFAHITALLLTNNFIGYGIAALYVALVIWVCKVPINLMLKGLRSILFVLMFAVTINLFLTPGDTVLVSVFFIRVTLEGILMALQMTSRLVLLIIGSSLLTLTTSPIKLTDGIEALLSPLKIIKLPAHDIAMMMTIALRFIPTLVDEMQKIMKAQKARGADFTSGNIIKRAKNMLPILIPLFVSAFKRADELATAMESRCYRGDVKRTKMKEIKMTPKDWVALGVVGIVTAVIIIV